MNRLGMMVDVSHASDRTFWDALEESRARGREKAAAVRIARAAAVPLR